MLRISLWMSSLLMVAVGVAVVGCGPRADRPADHDRHDHDHDHEQAEVEEGLALLDDEADRAAARRQRICPVSGELLGSMGKPIKVEVDGREVFICCAGCKDPLLEEPEKYLAKLNDESGG